MRPVRILLCLFCACGPQLPETEESASEDSQEAIQNGSIVGTNSAFRKTTVGIMTSLSNGQVSTCSGTILNSTHVLTASHCGPKPNNTVVRFFATGTSILTTRTVDRVFMPNWVNPNTHIVTSPDGQMRDIAVLHLSSAIPSGFLSAQLPTPVIDIHTQDGQVVTAVGAGAHDDVISSGSQMRSRVVSILNVDESSVGSDSGLFVSEETTNGGDSGGPIYANTSSGLKVVGALWGRKFRPASAAIRSYYTVVRDHVSWINSAMANNVAPTRILERNEEACNTTVKFSNIGTDTLMSRNDANDHFFTISGTVVHWTCDGTNESTSCPSGTNIIRVARNPAGTRDFVVECRQVNPAK